MAMLQKRPANWVLLAGLAVLGLLAAIGVRSCRDREARLVYDPTPAHEAELKNIVDGAVTFTVLHEAGHMMISELNLPVLGHEEDAADSFAVFVLTLDNPDVPEGSRAHTAQEAAVFFDGLYWNGRLHNVQPDWSDEHGQPEQRSNAISCLTIGIDPQRFSEFALQTNIPKQRLDGCPAEAAKNKANWAKTLFPAIEQSRKALDNVGQIVSPNSSPSPTDYWTSSAREPQTVIGVFYRAIPPDVPEPLRSRLTRDRDRLIASQALNNVKSVMEVVPVQKRSVDLTTALHRNLSIFGMCKSDECDNDRDNDYRVVGDACLDKSGAPAQNAFWSAQTRTITFCYALVELIETVGKTEIALTSKKYGH